MKKYIILLLLICLCMHVIAPSHNLSIEEWELMYRSICEVESENNKQAINGDAVGIIQIRPVYVQDLNRIYNASYSLEDRLCPVKSREMFELFQSHYNPERNIEKAIKLHILGPAIYRKNPERCEWYLNRVMKVMNRKIKHYSLLNYQII